MFVLLTERITGKQLKRSRRRRPYMLGREIPCFLSFKFVCWGLRKEAQYTYIYPNKTLHNY